TGAVALVEPNVNDQAALLAAFNQYRQQVGLPTVTQSHLQTLSPDGSGPVSNELALDISVVAGAVPNSSLLLYSFGSGTIFNAYQQAFFDSAHSAALVRLGFG